MQVEYETELQHWGIKGMKWRKDRPKSHKKKVTSGSGNTHRRGSGSGTGKVGTVSRPVAKPARPQSHAKKVTAGSGNTHRRGSGLGSKQPLGRRSVDKKYAAKNSCYTKRVLGR
jgi:hypothetical protein